MGYRSLIIGFVGAALIAAGIFWWWRAEAPEADRAATDQPIRIGVVRNPPALDPAWDGFRNRLKEDGYVEGKDIIFTVIEVGKDQAETKVKMRELILSGIDILYTMGNSATPLAKEITQRDRPDLPVIFGVVSDPVGLGLVASLRDSENNLTGVTPGNQTVTAKRLEIFREMIPSLRRMIFAYNNPLSGGLDKLRELAPTLGVTLIDHEVKDGAAVEEYFNSFEFRPGDGILRSPDSVNAGKINFLVSLAKEKKVPLAGTNGYDVEVGALMSYGADYEQVGVQAARLAERVMAGAKPRTLPVELAEKYELVINTATARVIGVEIGREHLERADRVINQ